MHLLTGSEPIGEQADLLFPNPQECQGAEAGGHIKSWNRREWWLCWPLKPEEGITRQRKGSFKQLAPWAPESQPTRHRWHVHCGLNHCCMKRKPRAHTLHQQLGCYFVLRRWFLAQEGGFGHRRLYKSQLQTLTRFVHFSHGRNMKIKILEWAEICLGNDLRSKEGKEHHRNSFKPSSHGQSWIACSPAVWNQNSSKKE